MCIELSVFNQLCHDRVQMSVHGIATLFVQQFYSIRLGDNLRYNCELAAGDNNAPLFVRFANLLEFYIYDVFTV